MKSQVIGSVIVFSLAIIAFKVLRPSTGFDSHVQQRLEQAGYGRVKNMGELTESIKRMDSLTFEQQQALLCVPNGRFRKMYMNRWVNSAGHSIIKDIKDGRDSIVQRFMMYRGFSKELAIEFIKLVRDSTYTPKQIFE